MDTDTDKAGSKQVQMNSQGRSRIYVPSALRAMMQPRCGGRSLNRTTYLKVRYLGYFLEIVVAENTGRQFWVGHSFLCWGTRHSSGETPRSGTVSHREQWRPAWPFTVSLLQLRELRDGEVHCRDKQGVRVCGGILWTLGNEVGEIDNAAGMKPNQGRPSGKTPNGTWTSLIVCADY